MDHALTNQDLGSDEAASCEVPLDDTELQRRLVETCEKELAPGGARRNRIWVILVVLAVFAMWWAFGVPQLLHGWFTDWWTMSSASSRHKMDQAALEVLMDPNWTPPPPNNPQRGIHTRKSSVSVLPLASRRTNSTCLSSTLSRPI